MSYRIHPSHELQAVFADQFPNHWPIVALNESYCTVTRAWVDGPFSRYFFDYLAARGVLKWKKRANQCEHFALRAALEAVYLFGQSDDPEIPSEAESIAVAAVKYRRDDHVWHEVNTWFLDGVWVPWEPQAMAFFQFSEAERITVCQPIIV
jgi:hypothetical protein